MATLCNRLSATLLVPGPDGVHLVRDDDGSGDFRGSRPAVVILIGKRQISTTEIAPPKPAVTEEDQLALEQRLYEESLKVLDEGQVLTGVIVAKYQEELLVDIGGKSEGTLPFRELSLAIDPKTLKVGDKLEVMIHRIDDDGELLSLRTARTRAEDVGESH